jgi:hypothetical protein
MDVRHKLDGREGDRAMARLVGGSKFEVKSHGNADEVRTPAKTRVELVNLPGVTIGRFTAEPGWRWSECIGPVAGTASCQVSHVGHVISGRVVIRMDDGSQKTIATGDSYTIPPGHDAWVEGDDRFICIEVMNQG